MKKSLTIVFAMFAWIALLPFHARAQSAPVKAAPFQAVPELPYRVVAQFFKFPKGMTAGEASAVAVNSKGLQQWTGIGYPYGLLITPDQHVWMTDGGYDRIVELDQNGKILGAFGEPGHKPGQMAWAHFMAMGPDQTIYVADVLNWRFDVFARTAPTGAMTKYIPSVRMFWGAVPSVGWSSKQTDIPFR